MINTNFTNECKNRANANRLGQIIVDGIDTPITNSDNLQSFEIDSGCYVDGNIIGSVYAKCLKANFTTNQNNIVEKIIQAQIGVKYANLSNEYINMGKYKVERPNNEITANMSQITAYDELYTNLDNEYICNIDYSTGNIVLENLYVDVCNQLGLIPKTTNFINNKIPIINNPFTNKEKNRTVLQIIAKIACSFIDIDADSNKIDLCWLSNSEEPDYTFYLGDYSSVEGGQVICGPINCLIIKNSEIDDENVTIKDEESIATYGEHSIIISEDYILYSAELREQAITDIWNRVKGLKYVDCKLTTYYGKPFLKLGDKIRIYISETEYFDTYVLKHNFTYDGAFTSVIESPALTEQEIKTKQDIKLGTALRNTQIKVNKQEQKINSIISAVDNNSEKISNVEQSVEGISQSIKDFEDLVRESTGREKVLVENAMAGTIQHLSITGKFELLYPEDELYPEDDLYPLEPYLVVENVPEEDEEAKKILYTLPIEKINIGETFEIDSQGKCTLTKQDGTIDNLGTLNVELFEGNNYIYITSNQPELLNYNVSFIIKNSYTDLFVTNAEMNSAITQTANEINLKVSKKVGTDEVISTINQSAEKIELKANRLVVDSDNFKLTEEGNVTAVSGDIGGFILNSTSFSKDVAGLYRYNDYDLNLVAMIAMNRISERDGIQEILDVTEDDNITSADYASIKNILNGSVENTKEVNGIFEINSNDPKRCLIVKNNSDNEVLSMGLGGLNSSYIACKNLVCGEAGSSITDWNGVTINGDTGAIRCVSLEQTSLKEMKKNFEKFENALDIIKNTDIYKFNYNKESDNIKKHIGLVIGEGYNYAQEITNNVNDGVDLYSMVSVCFKAIKEQQKQIEDLKKRIEELEGDRNGL